MFKKLKKQLFRLYSRQVGFTLMETVIVLGIFSIATTYAVSTFVQSNTAQKRTANIQRLISDARYILEVMAREVRMGSINYNYYAVPLNTVETELAILDSDNLPVRFGRRQDPSEPGRYAIWINTEPIGYPGGWREITPDNLTVERLDFYITPDDDPFTWQDAPLGYPYDQQPIVTIVLETKSLLGDESTEQHISRFQTTVTPRSYQR